MDCLHLCCKHFLYLLLFWWQAYTRPRRRTTTFEIPFAPRRLRARDGRTDLVPPHAGVVRAVAKGGVAESG
jgi:hypothetical protein